jgi:hypothetical protein
MTHPFLEKYPNVTKSDWISLLKERKWSTCLCKTTFYIKLLEKEWGIKIDWRLIRR